MEIVFWSIVVAVLLMFGIWFQASWSTHLEMTGKYLNRVATWVTFSKFLKLYAGQEWSRDEYFPESHFPAGALRYAPKGDQIHADIITIGGKGYKFGPISYIRYALWLKANRLTVTKEAQ